MQQDTTGYWYSRNALYVLSVTFRFRVRPWGRKRTTSSPGMRLMAPDSVRIVDISAMSTWNSDSLMSTFKDIQKIFKNGNELICFVKAWIMFCGSKMIVFLIVFLVAFVTGEINSFQLHRAGLDNACSTSYGNVGNHWSSCCSLSFFLPGESWQRWVGPWEKLDSHLIYLICLGWTFFQWTEACDNAG